MDRAKTAAEQIATVRGSGASRADNVTWLKSRHAQIDLAGLLPESCQACRHPTRGVGALRLLADPQHRLSNEEVANHFFDI